MLTLIITVIASLALLAILCYKCYVWGQFACLNDIERKLKQREQARNANN